MAVEAKENPGNPWLEIPLVDYERHMSAVTVAQAGMLADLLGELTAAHGPRTVAVLGCAGGNGLERIEPPVTRRVVVIDINAKYLETCRARYGGRFAEFESVCCDLSAGVPFAEPVELVYAGLVLEYLDVDGFLAYVPSLVTEGGRIAFVFQDREVGQSRVTESGVDSLRVLEQVHVPVDAAKVIDRLAAGGMTVEERRCVTAPGGKSFTLLVVKRPATR